MIVRALKQVFAEGRYVLLAATAGLAVFILATWLPNLGLVWQIAASGSIPLADKLKVLTALVGSIGTNFTVFSALTAISVAVLFGLNLAMIAYYYRLRRRLREGGQVVAATGSLGGMAGGLFGVGCAACGTFVLSPALTVLGAGGAIALLPLGGEEIGPLGVGMLGFSLFLTARKIARPGVCAIPADAANSRVKVET